MDRVSIVGSFLRPKKLLTARQKFVNREISKKELDKITDECILQIAKKQRKLGIKYISDGEFRKDCWTRSFLKPLGFAKFRNDLKIARPLSYTRKHPFIRDYERFRNLLGDNFIKTNIPALSQIIYFFHIAIKNTGKFPEIYKDYSLFRKEMFKIYKQIIMDFYNAGARFLQIDDTFFGALTKDLEFNARSVGENSIMLLKTYIKELCDIFSDKPKDLTLAMHICRENWYIPQIGDYKFIAKELFSSNTNGGGNNPIDIFYLEWDEERFVGSFESLKFMDKANVVLGLISTRNNRIKTKDELKECLKRASEFIDPKKLAISPQCGFSPQKNYINDIDENSQWQKLALAKSVIDELENEGFFS